MRASAVPLFCVQQPLQSLSAQVSTTVTTIVLVPDLMQMLCFAMLPSGKKAAMLWELTQASDLVPQTENCPAHWQPLYLMHSSLPGSGYEVYQVLLAVFQTRFEAAQGLLPP